MSRVTAARLRQILHYDPVTGVFTWLIRPRMAPLRRTAGTLTKGYVVISYKRRLYKAHRLAWLYMKGRWPPRHVDHRNRVRSDNRWRNLRLATRLQQAHNARDWRGKHSGLPRGVCRRPYNRFEANIRFNWRMHYLGSFSTPALAGAAYKAARRRLAGDFAPR